MLDSEIIDFCKELRFTRGKYDEKQIFSHLVMLLVYFINATQMGDIEYANKFDNLMRQYNIPEQEQMWKLILDLSNIYAKQTNEYDVLGDIYNNLGLKKKDIGQYFSPTHINTLIAKIASIDENKLKEKGFIALHEPACRCRWNDFSICKRIKRKGL